MGHTNETAQLLTVPPYVIACAATVATGFVTDKYRTRGLFVIGIASVA